jgi:hypothetical protein
MSRRARTRGELLALWRARDAAESAIDDAAREAAVAITLEAARDMPRSADDVVIQWAEDVLSVQLRPADPIPVGIRTAFTRAQAALWDGRPLPGPAELVDEPAQLCEASLPDDIRRLV